MALKMENSANAMPTARLPLYAHLMVAADTTAEALHQPTELAGGPPVELHHSSYSGPVLLYSLAYGSMVHTRIPTLTITIITTLPTLLKARAVQTNRFL